MNEKIYVNVDHKYFAVAVERLMDKLFMVAEKQPKFTILTEVNYNRSVLIIFDVGVDTIETVQEICASELIVELLRLQGIVLEARTTKGRHCAVMRVPAYRVTYQDFAI